MIRRLRYWYESDTLAAHRFRYGLLVFDIITVMFVIASSFMKELWWVEALDILFGVAILADFSARLAISRHRVRDLLHPATWIDVVTILSFLAPLAGEAGGTQPGCMPAIVSSVSNDIVLPPGSSTATCDSSDCGTGSPSSR